MKLKKIIILTLLTLIIIGIWIRPKKIIKTPVIIKGKIAICIDDFGYTLDNLDILRQIKYPLTCAILPNLNYSAKIAKELHLKGFEVILHLPMEPHKKCPLEKDTITSSQDKAEIQRLINQGLNSIKYAKGVSNHMGSFITENKKIMEIILKELKKKRLYFLDSFVSPNSVCLPLGRNIGLAIVKRDVFLDNRIKIEYIKGQINKLKIIAKTKGSAIGIGHDRKTTLEALREVMPQIEKEGYRFVFVSDLIN
ncbi:MAG: divergent polysaccharide deacetylase family protein [Candidatus Omnitrophota bacterium]|nr:divergent polysaccharide deacetylase family protein [Candidatus Omnitrophota bacterium]